MIDELIAALENRIELGEDKASLREEVLAAGHTEAIFESAYRIAYLEVADKKAAAPLVPTEQPVVTSSDAPVATSPQTKEVSYDLMVTKKSHVSKATLLLWLKRIGIGVLVIVGLVVAYVVVSSISFTSTDTATPVVQEESLQNQTIAAAIKNVQLIREQAEEYWVDNVSYAGVCGDPQAAYDVLRRTYDLGLGDVHCADNRGWYIVEVELDEGRYYCVDGAGTMTESSISRKGEETCAEDVVEDAIPDIEVTAEEG